MKPEIDYTLYLVTDREQMSSPTLEEAVESAIRGGCTLVQLREKDISSLEFYNTAKRVKFITDRYGVPLIINDRADIALAVNAAGVHVGQEDLPAGVLRQMLGENKIIGVSTSNISEALEAERAGADYLGVGAMFATDTKTNANLSSVEDLREIVTCVGLPVVVIGGINKDTVPLFADTGIDGLAVVSAILAHQDIEGAAKDLKSLFLAGK